MRILFLSESYYPYQSGVPIVVKYLAEGLVAKDYQVTIATSIKATDHLLSHDIFNGVEIYRFRIWRDVAKRLCGDLVGLQRFVMNRHFDCVIIECGQAATTDAVLPILKKISCPVLFHAHGLSGLLCKLFTVKNDFKHTIGAAYNWFRMQWYYGYTFKQACRYIDASISLTLCDSGYSYLERNVSKNFVLGNAADDMFFEPAKEQYKLPFSGKPFLVSIANYTVVKDQINMLRQFYQVENRDVALVMIGSQTNDYYQRVWCENKKLAVKYGERTVLMLTGIERQYFPSILDQASIYLTSSTYEEFSISIIEAMARGVPFISTDVGNARLLPGGVTVDTIADMHSVIDRLLSNEQERLRLGAAAQSYAREKCRIRVVVDQMAEIIEGVCTK